MDRTQTNISHILSHPLRLSLYELIRDGARTTPELAEILSINRINLYHHLNKMEEHGLIISQYNSNREKQYQIREEHPMQEISKSEETTTTYTKIINEPKQKDLNDEFQRQVRELTRQFGQNIPESQKIIQIHIFTQPVKIKQFKQDRLNHVKSKRSTEQFRQEE
jgi:DNA-binding transcriptional ArsR family regulator